jgi:hypothetical protein
VAHLAGSAYVWSVLSGRSILAAIALGVLAGALGAVWTTVASAMDQATPRSGSEVAAGARASR